MVRDETAEFLAGVKQDADEDQQTSSVDCEDARTNIKVRVACPRVKTDLDMVGKALMERVRGPKKA
jgi:hypothetical protein